MLLESREQSDLVRAFIKYYMAVLDNEYGREVRTVTIDPDLKLDRQIAASMPRAWSAFFGRFGRLTAVQRAAIPLISQGRDILLCSATASGKTEAVCAPLVERNIDHITPWKILYVTPTRALVNDLYGRLADALKEWA